MLFSNGLELVPFCLTSLHGQQQKKSFFFIHSQCLNNNIIKAYYAYDGEQGAKENAHERAMFEKPPDFEHNELQEQQLLW